MIKVFKNAESNRVWFIKNNQYHDYVRLVGNIFLLTTKTNCYE
jgi:hypothetical protein